MQEWLSLYESKSGERGIFNREAAVNIAKKNGRRNIEQDFGTNPCSEIILRPYQFCNLSTVIVRAEDSVEDLIRKARLAAVLGTFQSTLTHFPYLRKIWRENTEEERLLGVSMTGALDNAQFNNPDDPELPARLAAIREAVILENKLLAAELGIPQATATTAIKPEGTTSQLTDSASGLHPRHSAYYYRRVRSDLKDPLTQFMINAGVPSEPCVMKPGSTVVFTFAKKAPTGALLRQDLNALQHLKLWLVYQRSYCEHKPSVTISVSEKEWPAVGAFVWEHFDELSGVSFLPYDGGSYRQAPYEECSEAEYLALQAQLPSSVDWDSLREDTDNVEGVQVLACTANNCSLV
jgi:ribonucleoside-diphosphate reductase alpha chain